MTDLLRITYNNDTTTMYLLIKKILIDGKDQIYIYIYICQMVSDTNDLFRAGSNASNSLNCVK